MMNAIKSSALGFRFISNKEFIPLRWEIESVDKNYFDKISGDILYEGNNQEVYFMPDIPWNMNFLGKHVSSSPINIVYRLYDEDGHKEERSVPLFMRSVNDCIYQYKDVKLDFLFTAFVQEQHPEVDKILKEALNTKMIDAVIGYQGTEQDVVKQVSAVWRALHNRGIQYSSITTTSANSTQFLRSQQVRSFENAIENKQANCVDGTVVMASILRAMNISTVMVLTSNHCFLGFYGDANRTRIMYVETTMLSHDDLVQKAKTPAEKNKAWEQQFFKAVQVAMQEYNEYKAKNDLLEISVDYYRNYVRPLPF
jgi:hypothetical protein